MAMVPKVKVLLECIYIASAVLSGFLLLVCMAVGHLDSLFPASGLSLEYAECKQVVGAYFSVTVVRVVWRKCSQSLNFFFFLLKPDESVSCFCNLCLELHLDLVWVLLLFLLFCNGKLLLKKKNIFETYHPSSEIDASSEMIFPFQFNYVGVC